jgi:hypothetical protein
MARKKKGSLSSPRSKFTRADYLLKYRQIQGIADGAERLTSAIRALFPIEGGGWVFDRRTDDPGAVNEVITAEIDLEKLLNPGRTPYGGYRLRADSLVKPPLNWQPLYPTVQAIMDNHDRILHHYGWGLWIAGEPTQEWTWKWPEVPPICSDLLESMEWASAYLRKLVDPVITTLENGAMSRNPTWMAATDAAKLSEQLGFPLSTARIAELCGRHPLLFDSRKPAANRREVEQASFCRYVCLEVSKKARNEDEGRKDAEAADLIARAGQKKKKELPLD